jgi:5-formyltetrahydrofolate cyclo-ligase
MNLINQLKKEQRIEFLKKRRSLSQSLLQQQSRSICEQLAQTLEFQQAQVILAFFSINQEPDLSTLWQKFPGKIWGFPRCEKSNLIWQIVNILELETNIRIGKFGIFEPITSLPFIDLEQVDMILIPALACDRQGHRLGYGGGFYDRFLVNQRGKKVGITFTEMLVNSLPIAAWDIRLDAVCTEAGIFEIATLP